jgi:hypothetical protein
MERVGLREAQRPHSRDELLQIAEVPGACLALSPSMFMPANVPAGTARERLRRNHMV